MPRAFVLSGGGSLGAVQVGMLQALSARGIQPDLLVGTSAGAVNALWVACHGMSETSLAQLAQVWTSLRRRDVFPVSAVSALPALLGRARAVSSSDNLGELVRAHAGIDDLRDASIPVHLVATDLLNGRDVLISAGTPSDAVRASAAIPGIFPPVRLDGRWLVDGAMAAHSGVLQAVRLGAAEVYVLSAGVACALPSPPRSALGVAMHALTQLIEQRLFAAVADPPPGATVRLLPPLCPVAVSPADFSHAAQLIRRGRRASERWLAGGGDQLPDPARFLTLHHHREGEERAVIGDRKTAAELIEALGRWQESGGTWRVRERTASRATVALLRCDGGEEMDRLESSDPAWFQFLDSRPSSEGPGSESTWTQRERG